MRPTYLQNYFYTTSVKILSDGIDCIINWLYFIIDGSDCIILFWIIQSYLGEASGRFIF